MKLPANWKTSVTMIGGTLTGLLTFLSTVSYDQGPIAMIIPMEYKPWVFKIAGLSSLILFILNGIQQKDKNVTGGTTQQTTSGAVADPGTQSMVDQTVIATIQSGEAVTAEQRNAVRLT